MSRDSTENRQDDIDESFNSRMKLIGTCFRAGMIGIASGGVGGFYLGRYFNNNIETLRDASNTVHHWVEAGSVAGLAGITGLLLTTGVLGFYRLRRRGSSYSEME